MIKIRSQILFTPISQTAEKFISKTKTLPKICLNKRKSTHTILFQLNTLTFSPINNFMMDATELKLGGYVLLIINTGTRERDDYSRIPIGKQGIRCVFQRKENHWFTNFEETFRQHTFYQAEQHRLTFFVLSKSLMNKIELLIYWTFTVQITFKLGCEQQKTTTNRKCYVNPAQQIGNVAQIQRKNSSNVYFFVFYFWGLRFKFNLVQFCSSC